MELARALSLVRRRLRARRVVSHAAWGGALAAPCGLAAAVLGFTLAPPLDAPPLVALAPAALGLLAGALVGLARRSPPDLVVARLIEHGCGQGAVLSTALELAQEGAPPRTRWAEPVRREAQAALAALSGAPRWTARAVPWRWPGRALGALGAQLALIGVVLALPAAAPDELTVTRRAPAQLAGDELQSVRRLGSRLQRAGLDQAAPALGRAGLELERLARDVGEERVDALAALARLGEVEEELRRERARIEAHAALARRLAAEPLARALASEPGALASVSGAERAELRQAVEGAARDAAGDPALQRTLLEAALALGDDRPADEARRAVSALQRELAALPPPAWEAKTAEAIGEAMAELEGTRRVLGGQAGDLAPSPARSAPGEGELSPAALAARVRALEDEAGSAELSRRLAGLPPETQAAVEDGARAPEELERALAALDPEARQALADALAESDAAPTEPSDAREATPHELAEALRELAAGEGGEGLSERLQDLAPEVQAAAERAATDPASLEQALAALEPEQRRALTEAVQSATGELAMGEPARRPFDPRAEASAPEPDPAGRTDGPRPEAAPPDRGAEASDRARGEPGAGGRGAEADRGPADPEREGEPARGERLAELPAPDEPDDPSGAPRDPALAEAAAEAAREALARAEPPEGGDPTGQAGELPQLSPALLDMAAGMIRSLDPETLQSLAELTQERAEDAGEAGQPPAPPPGLPPGAEELLERLSEEDLRKLGQAFAGMQRDGLGEGGDGERPAPPPELAERLSELDPALLERMQRAMAGIEPPRGQGAGGARAEAGRGGPRAEGEAPPRSSSAPGAAAGSERTGEVGGPVEPGAASERGAGLASTGPGEGGRAGQAGRSESGRGGAPAGGAGPAAAGPGERGSPPPGDPRAADERHVLVPGRAGAGRREGPEDAPAARSRARVPLSDVPPATLEEALRALDRDPVPEGYERAVREYFRRWRADAEAGEDAPADPPR